MLSPRIFYLDKPSYRFFCLLNIKLFQGNTEDDQLGTVLHGGGGDVDFISEIKMEHHTSSPSVSVKACSTRAMVTVKPCLRDLLPIPIQVQIDFIPWIRVGPQREVDPPCSTEAGHKLASVDINTRRISLQTKLAGVEQFVVRDHGVR